MSGDEKKMPHTPEPEPVKKHEERTSPVIIPIEPWPDPPAQPDDDEE